MATKVSLRKKPIKAGKLQSLYLDFYPPVVNPKTGEPTRREFLKMYVVTKPNSPFDRQQNNETLRLAELIRNNRANELSKPEVYTEFEQERQRVKDLGEKCFVGYFRALSEKRAAAPNDNWISAFHYFEKFTGGTVKFAALNENLFDEFKAYLLNVKSNRSDKATLSHNTAVSYFNKVKATLRQAYRDGFLQADLNEKVAPIKAAETRRDYLTIEELNTLINTPCNNPLLKRAALFSALTGLRFSDIQKLVWCELVEVAPGYYVIRYTQKKTKKVEDLPISEQAYQLCGERGKPSEKVFEGLTYSAYQNKHLFQWIGAGGITKDITFHCFRHTYATLQLFAGTDIYTVSKMLGHQSVKTTQIYGKVVDEAKRKAANRIKLNF
jgi:integrase